MNVRSAIHGFKVVESVVQHVAVPMVDDLTPRERPVCGFPHDDGTQTPYVGLGDLYPCASSVALVAAKCDGAHRQKVVRRTSTKLGSRGSPHAFRRSPKIAGALGGAHIRAVVDLAALRRLPVEQHAADWAGEIRNDRRTARGATVSLAARPGAEDQAGPIAGESVRLDRERRTAPGACCVDHASQSTGSGTTLAVATGHGRDAIGIDLDERNAELALERVGPMLLTVEAQLREAI